MVKVMFLIDGLSIFPCFDQLPLLYLPGAQL